jgi:Carboxypeptidase regulatory-like domain/TonB dependent receptor
MGNIGVSALSAWQIQSHRRGVILTRIILLVLFCGIFAVGPSAQTFRGAINGEVTDPAGAAVPGALVKATEISTGIDHSTVASSDGVYAFQDLPLGSYKVTVTAANFPPYVVDKIEVTAGTIYTLNIKLTLEKQSTIVEVSAAELSLDTTTQVQNMTLPPEVVQNIPLNGRDFTQMVALAPGYSGYSVGGFGSLNGTRPNQMDWQIDGVDNNDFWHNIPAVNQGGVSGIAGIIMPIDAIAEFSVQTQSGAEAGRNAGGTVNQVLQSGGNTIHGSAYYYNRNEFAAASSPFFIPSTLTPKPPRLRNENYGGSVGGPIFKNKTFYYVAFEKQDYIIGLSGLATEPSTAWVNKALAVLNTFNVPVNPISQTLLGELYPGQTTQGLWPGSIAGLSGNTNNFFSSSPSTGYSYNGVAKIDHNFNDKEHLSVRGFIGQGSQTAPLGTSTALATASSNLAYYFEKAPIHVQNWAAVLNSTLTPTLTNQLLFGVNYFNQTFRDANASFDSAAAGLFLSPDALIHGNPILGSPNIAISGFEQVGITPPEGRNDVTGILTDIASYTMGKHQFRFGGEMRQGHVDEFYYRHSLGNFSFDGNQGPWEGSTAYDSNTLALADFLAGYISTGNISVGDAERKVVVNAFSLFAGDSWQVTNNLSVTLGLRYEYFGPLHNGSKNLPVFIPGQGLVIQGDSINSIFPPDRNNFAPRVGFAYKPTIMKDLVIRGGLGVFYDQINMNPFLDYRPPNGAADGLQGNPAGPSPVASYSMDGIVRPATGPPTGQLLIWQPNTYIFPGVTTCPTGNGCAASGYGIYSVNQNFRTPYFYNFSLQVEKSIGSFGQWQIGYVGGVGHKLSAMLNINQPDPVTGIRPFAVAYPDYGDINQLNSIGNSNYHSLQSTFRIRTWHGLTSQLTYTLGHNLDDVTEYRGVIPLDSTNLKQEYGNADFDTRNSFAGQATYSIPRASWATGWKSLLINDWQLSGLLILHGGQPFNITGGTSRPGQYIFGDPFAGVNQTFSAANGGSQWVNPGVFCNPLASPPDPRCSGLSPNGDLSRNRFYGPNFKDLDFSVIKNLPITERVKIQLRAEMYNTFNRKNLASGAGSVGSSGIVSDTIGDFNGAPGLGPGEPFNLQLVGKIIF